MANATSAVLRPCLFTALQKNFGRVKITNAGVPLAGFHLPENIRGKTRLRLKVTDFGESYYANCPFCSDTRQRMSVNHRFGVKDGKTGRRHLELVKCFNEDCFAEDYDRRKQLHATLFPDGRYADEVQPLPVKPVALVPSREAGPPPSSTRLDRLAPNHAGRLFVERRGLDPDALAAEFGVGYTGSDNTSSPRLYRPSLIIPVWSPGTLVTSSSGVSDDVLAGWQARLLDPRPGESKYMTASGLQTGRLLYNLPAASRAGGPLVVAEGVSDVWAVGANAVALFGKTISAYKADLVVKHAVGRPVVVWLDADACKEAEAVANTIRTARAVDGDLSPVCVAHCPAGRDDPGECTPVEVATVIESALSRW
ncbi:MAG: hypothetical protein ACPGYV_10640 [Phycisphaeraceae bacterium]